MDAARVVPPQSDILYLLAVSTMGRDTLRALSDPTTVEHVRHLLAAVVSAIWGPQGRASTPPRSLRDMFASDDYRRVKYTLTEGVVRPLDGIHRSAQELRPRVFIAGKGPAMQPTLCRHLGVTHIIRCFAKQARTEPPTVGDSERAVHTQTVAADILGSMGGGWEGVHSVRTHASPVCGGPTHQPVFNEQDELVFTGAGSPFVCSRLTLPAVDDDTYDPTAHLEPEVLDFAQAGSAVGGALLIHCSAGMHRSAVVACAVLMHLEMLASANNGALPPTVDATLKEIRSRRPMAEPTSTQREQLEVWAKRMYSKSSSN